jgi:hypothetical protein
MTTLDAVTKQLLNNFYKTQPALNKTSYPAAVSGVPLGSIIEDALNHPKPALDALTTKILNDFNRTQPALQVPGKPYASSGIQLGDIINQALTGAGSFVAQVSDVAHGLATGAVITVSNGTKATLNGAKTVSVSGANSFSIKTTSTPTIAGTFDWTIGSVGVAYAVTGTGPYLVTVTDPAHGLATGAVITVVNGSDALVDGSQTVTRISANSFSFSVAVAPANGTFDWSMGSVGVVYTCQVIDPIIIKVLNDYQKTQPALQKPGVPAASSGIMLGDLLYQALST